MSNPKIVSLTELLQGRLQFRWGPVALATGCFDILHRGHVELLEYAAELVLLEGADRSDGPGPGSVVVGLNSDLAVRTLKGESRPIHTFEDRATVIAGLRSVDYVTEIDDVRVANTIHTLAPTIWIKGGDYTLDTLDRDEVAAAHAVGARIVIVPTIGNYSTTSILKRL